MPKKSSPEAKLIAIFDDVTLERAELLLGVAKAMVNRKRRIFSQDEPLRIIKAAQNEKIGQ